jgi:predicted enzyme related to lactoylglutathione lyase
MPNDIAHFAIHATDCLRAKAFYETVFQWRFQPWGPPEFWLIETSPGAISGSLQKRRQPATAGGQIGYECTIAVADIHATAVAIAKAGGTVLMSPFTIEGVGTLVNFHDPEENSVCAMQYEKGARP